MADEIIDLTGSPPTPPSRSQPRILNFSNPNSADQFGNLSMTLWPNNNPPYITNHQQSNMWSLGSGLGHGYESTQIHIHQSIETQTQKILTTPTPWSASTSFQPNMHGGQPTSTVLESVTEANAYLFPHGTRFKETWTAREHELFLMGLIKYGRGKWTKITRNFLTNKTPQQVQSYANSYFRNLPSTNLYSFRRRNSANSSASYLNFGATMPLVNANDDDDDVDDDEPIMKTLMLFPEKPTTDLFQVHQSLFGQASTATPYNFNNNYASYYGSFQMPTSSFGAGSSSMNNIANGENYGEVDLELRLGRSNEI